jgi:hypothetical protein
MPDGQFRDITLSTKGNLFCSFFLPSWLHLCVPHKAVRSLLSVDRAGERRGGEKKGTNSIAKWPARLWIWILTFVIQHGSTH